MHKNPLLIGVIALFVGIGVGYFGSTAFATKSSARPATHSILNTSFGKNGAMGSILVGTIAAQDSESVTLNTRDGSSHVILLTPDTLIEKTVAGSRTDLATGANVLITGTTNSDGSISASSIELRPALPSASVSQ